MNNRVLYIVIAVLVVALAVLGFNYYQDQNTAKLEIKMGNESLSIEAK